MHSLQVPSHAHQIPFALCGHEAAKVKASNSLYLSIVKAIEALLPDNIDNDQISRF